MVIDFSRARASHLPVSIQGKDRSYWMASWTGCWTPMLSTGRDRAASSSHWDGWISWWKKPTLCLAEGWTQFFYKCSLNDHNSHSNGFIKKRTRALHEYLVYHGSTRHSWDNAIWTQTEKIRSTKILSCTSHNTMFFNCFGLERKFKWLPNDENFLVNLQQNR